MWTTPREITTAPPPTEESCPLAEYTPPTGYEPKLLDDFDHSETSAMIFQDESGDTDTDSSHSCDAELDDETMGKVLIILLQVMNNSDEINYFVKNNYQNKIGIFVKSMRKVSMRWKN